MLSALPPLFPEQMSDGAESWAINPGFHSAKFGGSGFSPALLLDLSVSCISCNYFNIHQPPRKSREMNVEQSTTFLKMPSPFIGAPTSRSPQILFFSQFNLWLNPLLLLSVCLFVCLPVIACTMLDPLEVHRWSSQCPTVPRFGSYLRGFWLISPYVVRCVLCVWPRWWTNDISKVGSAINSTCLQPEPVYASISPLRAS